MKYKVGDRVYLKTIKKYERCGDTDWLNNFGKIVTIYEITNDMNGEIGFVVKKDDNKYFYDFNDIDHEKTAQLSSNTQDIKQDDNVVCMTEEEILGDNVNHPKHYTQGEIETIDKIKYLTEDFNGIEAVCIGNFIKYIDRCNLKGGMEDLEKAKWYLDRFLDEFYDDIMG